MKQWPLGAGLTAVKIIALHRHLIAVWHWIRLGLDCAARAGAF